jgi:hypothetical protein
LTRRTKPSIIMKLFFFLACAFVHGQTAEEKQNAVKEATEAGTRSSKPAPDVEEPVEKEPAPRTVGELVDHGEQTGSSGSISYPFGDGEYANNENNVWRINANCATVNVVATSFNTEAGYDYVIIDGHSFAGLNSVISLHLGNTFDVTFTSDGSVTRSGFDINWYCVTDFNGGVQTGTSGTVSHQDYGNGENIVWQINADCDWVNVISTELQTENWHDRLYVHNMAYIYSHETQVSAVVPGLFHVQFTSDGSVTGEGFVLNWRCTTINAESTGFTGNIDHTGGYDNGENFSWLVRADCDRVRVTSSSFNTEGNYDYVFVHDTQWSGSGLSIDHEVPGTFIVNFRTDGSVVNDGFALTWTCTSSPANPDGCPNDSWAMNGAGICEPVGVTVSCGPTGMTVSFSTAHLFATAVPGDATASAGGCTGVTPSDGAFNMEIPFDSCGTTFSQSGGRITASNRIVAGESNPAHIVFSQNLQLDVSCAFDDSFTLLVDDMAVTSHTYDLAATDQAETDFASQVSISAYTDDSFSEGVSSSNPATVGSPVYVDLTVHGSMSSAINIVAHSCRMQDAASSPTASHSVISDGCKDSITSMTEISGNMRGGSGDNIRFSFTTFTFPGAASTYLECSISVCALNSDGTRVNSYCGWNVDDVNGSCSNPANSITYA